MKPIIEKDVDVVSGKYIGTGDSIFQQIVSKILLYDFNKIKTNSFSPSKQINCI